MTRKRDGGKMAAKEITITIKNWAKYNPRSDRSNYSWFRFENRFFYDQAIFELGEPAVVLFLFILCECSQRNSGTITLKSSFISALLGKAEQQIDATLGILCDSGILTADCRQGSVIKNKSGRHDDAIKNESGRHDDGLRDETRRDETGRDETVPALLEKSPPKTHASWEAFRHAYASRYGTAPVRSAKVNAQLAKLVEYLGASEAPQVIEFYLRHNSSYYANKGHDLGLLLIDYQKLRTEWITGRQITTAQARSDEAKQHNVQVVQDWLKKKMAGEEGSG